MAGVSLALQDFCKLGLIPRPWIACWVGTSRSLNLGVIPEDSPSEKHAVMGAEMEICVQSKETTFNQLGRRGGDMDTGEEVVAVEQVVPRSHVVDKNQEGYLKSE